MDHRDQTRFPSDGMFTPDADRMRLILNVGAVWDVDEEDEPPPAVLDDEGNLLETVSLPARYEVCHLCEGKGRYVNPNIDRNGLDPNDPDLDEDFWMAYNTGRYDVPCNRCKGEKVTLELLDADEVEERYQDIIVAVNAELSARAEAEYYCRMEEDAERRAFGG